MNRTIFRTLFIIAVLLTDLQPAQSQSIWEKTKEKAKSAWNSNTRKKAWEKTKSKTKELYEKGKSSDMGKKSQDLLDSHQYTVPVTKRKFLNIVPDSYILSLSKEQYRSYLSQSKKSNNQKYIAQVKRVTQRMSQAVKQLYIDNGMRSELSNFQWEFNVVKNTDANAFCMPGGKIVVYEGILPVAGNDASLAFVIGHEIAHAIAKHSSEQMTKRAIEIGGIAIAYTIISNSDMSDSKKMLASVLASTGVALMDLKFSRMNETEADRIGLILTAMAGYDPEEAIGFWTRMSEKSDNKSTHDWFSTHPSHSNRINNIKSMIPEARKYYKR